MLSRQAEATCPSALSLVRDPGKEASRFEPVVLAAESVVPRVELVEPGLLFIPVEGAVRYYGSEEHLAERVLKEVGLLEQGALVGLADGPFAARWAASKAGIDAPLIVNETGEFLASLDIGALDHPDMVATFRWLGVTTLGELANLPRAVVASRFGNPGLSAHRLATGEDRPASPRSIPEGYAVEERFEEPLESVEQAAFAARATAARLISKLAMEGIAPHRVVVDVEAADGSARSRVWRSADPFTESVLTDRVWWQLRAWIEQGGVPGGVIRMRIDPADLSGEGRQMALLEDGAAEAEAARAFARAQALLGPDSVLVPVEQPGRMPSERVSWGRWGEETRTTAKDTGSGKNEEGLFPLPGTTPSPMPALVPPDPVRLEIDWDDGTPQRVRLGSRWEPVLNWSGPWRLTGRWWKGEINADRYQLVTSAGAFLCLVNSEGTFLAGVYD